MQTTVSELPTYDDTRHPGWLRCWLYAMDHSGEDLGPGHLGAATGLEPRTLSRSLRTARRMGLLTPESDARCVTARVVTGG